MSPGENSEANENLLISVVGLITTFDKVAKTIIPKLICMYVTNYLQM